MGVAAPRGVCLFVLAALLARAGEAAEALGVCWGRVAWQVLPPAVVVKQLQDNNITQVKLFNADPAVLAAFTGTGIELMVMVNNTEVITVGTSMTEAQAWVDRNVQTWLPSDVNIKYISVGNEPYLTKLQDVDEYLRPAVDNIYQALVNDEIDDKVKVTVSFNAEILENTSPPTGAHFTTNWTTELTYIANLIMNTSSIFSVNIYPFYNMYSSAVPQLNASQIFFDQATTTDPYENVFYGTFDALLYALDNASIPSENVTVILGEIGWPTDGDPVANLSWAQSYNQQVIQKMLSGTGTPKRPNQVIRGYLFSLFDEDAKSILPGAFERRWGIYDNRGTPKYNLDLTGGANANAVLASTPGIYLEDQKWCVAKWGADTTNLTLAFNSICVGGNISNYGDKADCTPVTSSFQSPGDVCGGTSFALGASYALNAYYQIQGQNESFCDWGGVAQVVTTDPSSSFTSCTFKVGLNLVEISNFTSTSSSFSFTVVLYLIALMLLLSAFL